MRSLSKATACLSTVALGLAMGCATESFSGPDPVIARDGTLSASTTVIPCPPTVPTGYTLVTCFDFDLIPGVWHGFIVHSPTTPGALSNDYLLISPTGFQYLVPGSPVNTSVSSYTFQPEGNGTIWYDVVRIILSDLAPAERVTIAVARRALTPSVQTAAIVTQVNQLLTSGALSGGQATSLLQKLDAIIAKLDAGNTTPAVNQLVAFVHQVQSLVSDGVLNAAQGQALIDAANAVIARLTP